MPDFKGEPLSATEERDFLWEKCLTLYKVVSNNGQISSNAFRVSTQMAGNMFKGQLNITGIVPWFAAMADFLEWMETAMKQKGISVC